MKLSKRLLATAALIAPSFVFAASGDSATQLVNKIAQGKATIVKEFNSIGNLKGFVIQPAKGQGQKTIVYADKNGQYMIAGAVITADGTNQAEADYNTYINAGVAPKVFAAAGKTAWIQDGKSTAPHKAYILVEPNCIACHMLYNELKPMVASGQLAVRWIFVAFMRPESEGMVASILQSNNPSQALAMDESGFNVKTEHGGITPAKNISAQTKQKIQTNMNFMTEYQFSGTPVISYKTTSGDYQVIPGFLPGAALQEAVKSMSNSF